LTCRIEFPSNSSPSGGTLGGIIVGAVIGAFVIGALVVLYYRNQSTESKTAQVQPLDPPSGRIENIEYSEMPGGKVEDKEPMERSEGISEVSYGGRLKDNGHLEIPGGGLRYPDAELLESGNLSCKLERAISHRK